MKIYFAPEFARQVEQSPPRTQNIVKLVAAFFEHHEWCEILAHPKLSVKKLSDRDLYAVRFEDVRILASFVKDAAGEFWIFAQLDQ